MGELRRKMGRWRDFIDGWNDDLRYEQMKPGVYPPGQRPLSDPRWLQTTRGKGFLIFVFVGMSAMVTMPLWPDKDNTSSTGFRNQKKPNEHKPALIRAVSQ